MPGKPKQPKQDKHPHFTLSRIVACGWLLCSQLSRLAETDRGVVIGGDALESGVKLVAPR